MKSGESSHVLDNKLITINYANVFIIYIESKEIRCYLKISYIT